MAKAKTVQPVIDQEPSDLALVRGDGEAIQGFLKALPAFFSRASQLERQAKATLEIAKGFSVPVSMEADAKIQRFVKQTTADRKETEAHWGICQIVSGVHRRLTAARARAVDPLEHANQIGNRLHNTYVETERRRAAEEQERLRREAEARARQERELELAKLEAEAVAREEASPELSERETIFVEAYIRGGNAACAAKLAHFKNPDVYGFRLLSTPKILTAIERQREALDIRRQAAAQRTAPLEVQVEDVKPEIARTGGYDRTNWSGEILDEARFVEAVFSGQHGIPRDVLMVNPAKLNEYARSLHERLDLWPGVRAKKSTRVV